LLSETHLRKLLLDILNAYQRVELGSIGSLTLENKDAQIHEDKILPPHDVIGFTRILVGKGSVSFANAIADSIITEDESEALTTYLNERLARLHLLNSVSIFDLGTLTSNDSLVEWKSDYTDQTLPIISLPQIIQSKTATTLQNTSIKTSHTPQINTAEESEYSNFSKWLLPLCIIVSGTFLLAFLARGCFTNQSDEEKKVNSQDILEVADDDIAPFEELDTTRLFNHPQLEKYKDVLTTDVINKGCMIVVGSFKNQENARRMEERVLTEGYSTLVQVNDNRSRVVVTFDCLEKDLIDFLKEIQENVSPKSWYLSPRFEPEL